MYHYFFCITIACDWLQQELDQNKISELKCLILEASFYETLSLSYLLHTNILYSQPKCVYRILYTFVYEFVTFVDSSRAVDQILNELTVLVSTRTSQKFALPIELMSLDSGMLHASIFLEKGPPFNWPWWRQALEHGRIINQLYSQWSIMSYQHVSSAQF